MKSSFLFILFSVHFVDFQRQTYWLNRTQAIKMMIHALLKLETFIELFSGFSVRILFCFVFLFFFWFKTNARDATLFDFQVCARFVVSIVAMQVHRFTAFILSKFSCR